MAGMHLRGFFGYFGRCLSWWGIVVFILAFIGNFFIAETFAKDLDFYEE